MKWRIGSQRDMIAFSGRRRVGDASNAVGRLARIYMSQWQQGGRNLGIGKVFIWVIAISQKEIKHLKS